MTSEKNEGIPEINQISATDVEVDRTITNEIDSFIQETTATVMEVEIDESMNNLLASLHKIDRSLPEPIQRDVNTADAAKYVQQLLQETMDNPNKRAFAFKNTTSPIYGYILDIFNSREEDFIENLFNTHSTNIAIRLMSAEDRSVEKYPTMKHPKKGSLIITANKTDEEFLITIAKIETAEFLEDINLQLQTGLPFNKKALKTAIISITENEDEEIECLVTVTDSGSAIAKYWTDDFLEVTELTSNEKNTFNAFTSIEKVITKNLKNKAPSDCTELRNNLVGYFKTQAEFQYENMIEHVFGNYTMENSEINLEVIKEKVNKLLEKEKFDTHFTIISKEIKTRFKKTYQVTEQIELRTNGHIENLRRVIRAKELENGEKVLEIKVDSDIIYKQFKFLDVTAEESQ